jgi:excisionase family DNA binding protein
MAISEYGFRPPFYTCPVCKEKIPSEIYTRHRDNAHNATRGGNGRGYHIRPADAEDAMTTSEVAKVLGISAATVLYKVNTGKLKALSRPPGRGHPIWITSSALKRYINQQSQKTDVAVKWAATGVLDG